MDASYIIVVDYECVFSGAQAIARARNRLGDGYSMLRNNCEHFVTWLELEKERVNRLRRGMGHAGLVGLTSGAVAGAAFGTIIPVVGTRIAGGAFGVVAGGVLGLLGGIFAYLVQSKSS